MHAGVCFSSPSLSLSLSISWFQMSSVRFPLGIGSHSVPVCTGLHSLPVCTCSHSVPVCTGLHSAGWYLFALGTGLCRFALGTGLYPFTLCRLVPVCTRYRFVPVRTRYRFVPVYILPAGSCLHSVPVCAGLYSVLVCTWYRFVPVRTRYRFAWLSVSLPSQSPPFLQCLSHLNLIGFLSTLLAYRDSLSLRQRPLTRTPGFGVSRFSVRIPSCSQPSSFSQNK